MSLVSGLIAVAICLLVVWLFPKPRYGQMRGCTGRALQTVMEQKEGGKTGGCACATRHDPDGTPSSEPSDK